MARKSSAKAVNVPDNSKARSRSGNTTTQQKPTATRSTKTNAVGRQAKGSPTPNKAFNKDEPGGNAPGRTPTRKVGDTMNPKGAANREGAGGYGANTFTGKRGYAPQKKYSVSQLKDDGGGKGAKGK